jgi:hypothetical protein
MMSQTQQLRRKAVQCRIWASTIDDDDVRHSQLLAMAEQYDRVILQIEGVSKLTRAMPAEGERVN